MSKVGHCADNAVPESFFGVINRKRIRRRRYLNLAEVRSYVFDYIERPKAALICIAFGLLAGRDFLARESVTASSVSACAHPRRNEGGPNVPGIPILH